MTVPVGQKSGTALAVGGAVLALAVYVPFLLLPAVYAAVGPDPVIGWEGLLVCFLMPGLWPVAASHLLFYFGVVALLMRRWRTAWVSGAIGFAIGAFSGILFLLTGGIGQVFKLLAMGLVAAVGFIGHRAYGTAHQLQAKGTIRQREPPEAAAASMEEQMRRWARLLHLSVLASFLVGFFVGPYVWFIAPIVIWQMKKTALPEIVVHGKNAVNWLISAIIYAVLGVILMVVISFIALLLAQDVIVSLGVFWGGVGSFLLALGVVGFIFPIVAAIKANHGEVWKYPLSIRFLK